MPQFDVKVHNAVEAIEFGLKFVCPENKKPDENKILKRHLRILKTISEHDSITIDFDDLLADIWVLWVESL